MKTRVVESGRALVSVIIPCYNQAKYLAEAVESVVAQGYSNWEIIIVNDGSQDNTSEVARGLVAQHPNRAIRLLEQANRGLAEARNAGIRASAGQYILPLDADDRIVPAMLEKTLSCLEANPATAIAYTDAWYFGSVNRPEATADFDFTLLRYQNHLNYCSLFRREVWDRAGGYNRNLVWGYEDWDFWISCAAKGFTARRIPEPLFHYRVKAQSMYTAALEHDLELRARIVMNHPALYAEPTPTWARAILENALTPDIAVLPEPHEILTRAKTFAVWRGHPRNIVFVSREFGPDSMGSCLAEAWASLAAAGHRVFLVSDHVAEADKNRLPRAVELIATEGSLPHQAGHFFCDNQEYAYRVLNTLRGLAQRVKLDVIEFPVCRGEGFATIRAKRLLNEFGESKLIIHGGTPLSLLFQNKEIKAVHVSMYCDFEIEDYCVRHADVVTAPTSALAKYFQDRTGRNDIRIGPGPSLDTAANQVVGQASRLSTGRLALEAINTGGTPGAAGGTPAPLPEQLFDNYTRPLPPRLWRRAPAKKVSAIIPFYNQGQYLAEAVQSVRDSGWPDLEIIVVNDGSSEDSANEAFESIGGVVKVRQKNGGLSSARNAGIRAATGDYLLMLDADDKIHPDYIATAIRALENNPALSYLTCHAQNFGVLTEPYIPVGFVPALMPFLNTDGKCANVYRREVFAAAGGYDESLILYEDWDLLLTLHERGLKGDVLPAEFLLYRRHFDSMVFTVANPRRVELVQQLMLKHRKFVEKDAQMIAVLLAGLWQWQAIRADDALARHARMLAEEPGRVRALETSELRVEYARQTSELRVERAREIGKLRANHAQEIGRLGADHAREMSELRAEHARELKRMRVEQVYANGLPVRTRELKFMLRKYLKRKLRALMPPPRRGAGEVAEPG